MESVLRAEKLIRNYKLPNAEEDTIKVLKGLDFVIEQNEFVGIMGKSGCGKTTLLKLLGLIERPTGGEMYFKEKKVKELWEDELADLRRRKIGFVFQDFYLMDSLSAGENIMVPMILDKAQAEEMKQKMHDLARRFGVEKLIGKSPGELSGGEKQRIAICRALINDPGIIMADEPTGNLDAKSSRRLMDTFDDINKEMGKNIILVTHDPKIARCSDKIFFIDDGVIVRILEKKEGDTSEFYREILREMEKMEEE